MKFKKIKEKDNEIEFILEGEDHSFSQLLLKHLLDNKDVEIAEYKIPHPLMGSPTFYVRTKGKKKPLTVLEEAADSIKKQFKSLK